jgi:ABC-type amino acid transport system permease subunit
MILDLLIGFPGERPGGLVLTVLYFVVSGTAGLVAGLAYAAVCVAFRRGSLLLQSAAALLRGVPLILLVFLLAQVGPLPAGAAALAGLALYSAAHAGEILRAGLAAYPQSARDAAKVAGLSAAQETLRLRVPRTVACSTDALATHWASLLKDTGALVVLSIGELTTVARTLSASDASTQRWAQVLLLAAGLYLAATLLVLKVVDVLRSPSFPAVRMSDEH